MGAALKTPYDVLGVSQTVDSKQLRNIFRSHIHALKQGKLSKSEFRDICRAYECLSDYDKRRMYDECKIWTYRLPISHYTLQQLAGEYILMSTLEKRLNDVTLREINAQDPTTGHTALYCAARVGNSAAVLYLIGRGAEPDLSQRTKSTALHVSAFYGHPSVVRCLLEAGADYRIKNAFGHTAEEEAYDNDVNRVFTNLKQTPFVQAAADQLSYFKNAMNNYTQHIDEQYYVHRQTLLHCASKKGYLDLVSWLVEERSAHLDIVDMNLNSALHLSAYGGHASIVEYLLNRGANPLLVNKWNMTAKQEGEYYCTTILPIFARMRNQDMFEIAKNGKEWWFQYYFGSNSPDALNTDGTSLLYIACRHGQISVAKWLLEHGANVNLQLKHSIGSTPLHAAAYHEHVPIVELLLAYGADVNIKNSYGATVFDEHHKPDAIRTILEQYRRNLKDDKIMPVHVYAEKLGENDRDEPIAKIHLHYDAKQNDLMEALHNTLRNQHGYLSIARRPLQFENDNTTVLTAVCSARYARTKFVEIPLRLTFCTDKLSANRYNTTRSESTFDYSTFVRTFEKQSHSLSIDINASHNTEQTFNVYDLSFFVAACSNNKDVSIHVQYIRMPDLHSYDLPGCLCLFKITYESRTRLKEPPTVSLFNEPNVRVYTLASPSPYWFTYDTYQKRLPMVGGIHAFFRHVDIIPGLLSLPADMFIAAIIEEPLMSRTYPVPCKYLELRKHNADNFPFTAYHGTRIDVVQSILMNGLVISDTLVAGGMRIKPPPDHIPRNVNVFNIPNFAGAIFLSPSIYYSSDPIYARSFEHGGKRLLTVLECSVKAGSYSTHTSTVRDYKPNLGDDLNTIEWRIHDPTSIEINAVLFIIKEFDQRKKT